MTRKTHFAIEPSEDGGIPKLTPNALTRQEFGRRLMKAIREKGWNQSQLAREADLGRDAISNYVNGHNFPTPKSLDALCQALDVTADVLFPNSLMSAMDDEVPAFELKAANGHPGKAWVRVNRAMSFEAAVEIARLLNVEDGRANRDDN